MTLTRPLHPDFAAVLAGPFFWPVVMVHLDWPVTPIRAHTGTGTISWDGHDWTGVGRFGQISLPDEGFGMASTPASVALFGLPDDLDDIAAVAIRGRAAEILFGAVTEPGGSVLIGDPALISTGTMAGMVETVSRDSAAGDLVLTRGVRIGVSMGPSQRSSARLAHTPEDQAAAFPGDTAGRHVLLAEANATKLRWPAL